MRNSSVEKVDLAKIGREKKRGRKFLITSLIETFPAQFTSQKLKIYLQSDSYMYAAGFMDSCHKKSLKEVTARDGSRFFLIFPNGTCVVAKSHDVTILLLLQAVLSSAESESHHKRDFFFSNSRTT